MSIDSEAYQRIRGQVTFLLSVIELLANSIDRDSAAARTARRAVGLARTVIASAETAADTYAAMIAELDALQQQIERLKSEGRPPSNLEWEALRADMESASAQIAAAVATDPAMTAGD